MSKNLVSLAFLINKMGIMILTLSGWQIPVSLLRLSVKNKAYEDTFGS